MVGHRDNRGFTLVELVIAIALLGIVSVTVSSRWFSTDAFQADTLKEQLIAEARLAQRTALANSQISVSLVVSEAAGDWRYQIFQDDGSGRTLMREVANDTSGVTIEVTTGATQVLGPGVDFDLTYDGLGNAESLDIGGVSQNVASGVFFELMGGTHELCISPLGFAHEGNCV